MVVIPPRAGDSVRVVAGRVRSVRLWVVQDCVERALGVDDVDLGIFLCASERGGSLGKSLVVLGYDGLLLLAGCFVVQEVDGSSFDG